MTHTLGLDLPTSSDENAEQGLGLVSRRNLIAGGAAAAGLVGLNATVGAESAEASTLSTRRQAYNHATTRVGAPYVWGATGPWQFDCSGLVHWSYGRLGRYIGRTTSQQWYNSRAVSASYRSIGDLIFFGYGSNTYHVGMYAGYGYILDAPKPGYTVRKRKLWTNNVYYRRVY